MSDEALVDRLAFMIRTGIGSMLCEVDPFTSLLSRKCLCLRCEERRRTCGEEREPNFAHPLLYTHPFYIIITRN